MPDPWSSTEVMTSPSASRTRTVTSPPFAAELERVMHEIDDDLADPRLVASEERQVVRDVHDEPQALAIREQSEALDGFTDDPAEVDVV